MSIAVEVRKPTKVGRLYPTYDEESGMLVIESRVQRPWPYGMNVDGLVILDLDADRRLVNVDCLIPRHLWEVTTLPPWPRTTVLADLVASKESISQREFDDPVVVRCDPDRRHVAVRIGLDSAERFVELSPGCLAGLSGDSLVEFRIRDLD